MTDTMQEVVVGQLTADDVKALRQADHVSFHWHAGKGSVVCTKRVRKSGPFDEQERRHEFAVRCRFYGPDGEPRACFAMVYGYDGALRTMATGLRAGDAVTLAWSADGAANGYFKGAVVPDCCENVGSQGMKLHVDTLRLYAKRPNQPLELCWVVDTSICPDNSARMIRP